MKRGIPKNFYCTENVSTNLKNTAILYILYYLIKEMGICMGHKKLNEKFKKEYRKFITDYLFPLVGLVDKELVDDLDEIDKEMNIGSVVQKDSAVYFYASRWKLFKVDLDESEKLTDDNVRLANRVIQAFGELSENKRTGSGKQNNILNEFHRAKVYQTAVERGICSWIVNHSRNIQIEHLFSILEKWSVKTYEGRKVTLGFVIDSDKKSNFNIKYGDWLSFLEDDAAAVLSDCIHSVIELDGNCNFINFLSISQDNAIPANELSYRVPLRFTQIIQQYVREKENRIGVFLLSNGDIILAKDGATRFVKRNLQWLNFSYEAFHNALKPFIENYSIHNNLLLESIFASMLDVSFSHAGGIIAIVGEPWQTDKENDFETDVLHCCDNLLSGKTCLQLENELMLPETDEGAKEKNDDTRKRLLKRNVLQSLIKDKAFEQLDRKLRSELMSLDGACILNCNGKIVSFGAIIRSDSGSTGGGRGAAAKKLSAYGMAVKISTDGYIELYINQSLKYAIK